MKILVRTYRQSDYLPLINAMENFQDYLVAIDPLQRLCRLPKYGQSYTRRFVSRIKAKKGRIFIATNGKQIIGFIGGVIEKQTNADLFGCISSKDGRVLELFVSAGFRNKSIGKILMDKMEDYFKKERCTTVRIEVLSGNNLAHHFYKKANYLDRTIDMIKILK